MSVSTLEHHWMPFSANRDFKVHPRLLARAEGPWYWRPDGQRVFDAVSGLFSCPAGHGRETIADAVGRQLRKLDFVSHFQFGHEGSFELARRVSELTPEGLDRVFFANSGSEAVDTALKIALAYHRARGEGQRVRLVGRERAYHGVNFGGISVGGMVKNRQAFGPGLPGVVHLRHTWLPENRFTPGQPGHGAELADDLQRFVDLHGADTIAACIVEPIAGSVGVLVPPVGYLQRLRDICTRAGILLIFDEVICGFGRTGHRFAADAFGVLPDMITMAKALTNGAQPMGAVAVHTPIYEAVTADAPEWAIELFHGYTYSGHPAACAAGLAALDIYAEESLFERAAGLVPTFLDGVFGLRDLPAITDIRGYGLFAALDLAPSAAPGQRGYDALQRCFDAGLYVKVTGDSLLLAPPFVTEPAQLEMLFATLREVLGAYS